MKITLINPPFLFPEGKAGLSHCIGLRSLSSVLKADAHEVCFIDALMLGLSNVKRYGSGRIVGLPVEQIDGLIPLDTDLIGVSVPFSQLAPIAHEIVERAKLRFPNSLIVMGGMYPSSQPELALTSKADLVVVGEGENPFESIVGGKDSADIPGVYSTASNNGAPYSPAKRVEDLDALPLPDYSIPRINDYFSMSPRGKKGRLAALVTSRGCPFDCEFCSVHPVCGHVWRARSAESVIEEIRYLVERHEVDSLEFEDDNFTLKRDRTVAILEGITRLNEKGANLRWRTPNGLRIDTLDEGVIELMKRSGCRGISLALEHGDEEVLRIMNKKLDLDKAFNVLEMSVKHKIKRIDIFIIVGYPGETRERFKSSLRYLKRIKKLRGNIVVNVFFAQPHPGTRLLKRCIAEGYVNNSNYSNFLVRRDLMSTANDVSITTPDFDAREVMRRKKRILRMFR